MSPQDYYTCDEYGRMTDLKARRKMAKAKLAHLESLPYNDPERDEGYIEMLKEQINDAT